MRDILHSAKDGLGITRIMFHAYLTHNQAKEYIQALMNSELLKLDVESGSLKRYSTTPKGLEYLNAAEDISRLLSINTRRAVKATGFLF